MKRFVVMAVVSGAGFGCSAPLAMLPPSDTYTTVDQGTPQLSKDEQKLLEGINKELDRLGLPTATAGSYEMNVAALMANVALARMWKGSGRSFVTNRDVAAPSSAPETVVGKHASYNPRIASLTDEEDDAELKHLHPSQHQVAYGIPPINTYLYVKAYAATELDQDELKKAVQILKPEVIRGELHLGVAVLPIGDDDKRLWAIVLRDRVINLLRGPPRVTEPGSSFDVAGTVSTKKVESLRLALLGPDGKVQLFTVPVEADGTFATSVTLPAAPGLYTFELQPHQQSGLVVPIFVGVPPTPWPVSGDPKTPPPDGTRAIAKQLAKLLANFRKSHGLAPVSIDADLSAFSKSEASALAKLHDESSGPGAVQSLQEFVDGEETRVHAAGFDKLGWHWAIAADDYIKNYYARFPATPSLAAELGSPTATAFGIGVTLVPHVVNKDEDWNGYAFVITIKDPTPPEPTLATPVAAPAPTPETAPVAPGPAPVAPVSPTAPTPSVAPPPTPPNPVAPVPSAVPTPAPVVPAPPASAMAGAAT